MKLTKKPSTEAHIKVADLKKLVEKSLDESKAQDIVTINLKGKTEIADFMVVASGTSSRHVNSIASKLLEELRHNGIKGIEPEGAETGEWVLVDAFDVIVHIFKPETRQHYDIEKMWQIPAEGKPKRAAREKKEPKESKPKAAKAAKKSPAKKPVKRAAKKA